MSEAVFVIMWARLDDTETGGCWGGWGGFVQVFKGEPQNRGQHREAVRRWIRMDRTWLQFPREWAS